MLVKFGGVWLSTRGALRYLVYFVSVRECCDNLVFQNSFFLCVRAFILGLTRIFEITIWNRTSNIRLYIHCPIELKEGSTPDISVFRFEFYQRVKFRRSKMHFPSSSGMQTGRFLGIAWNAGDTFTYYVLDDESRRVLTRGVVVAVISKKSYIRSSSMMRNRRTKSQS